MDAKVEQLAADVATLSNTVADIEKREASGASSGSAGTALQSFKKQMLDEMKELRITMEAERAEMAKVIAERDQLEKTVALETKRANKAEYRCLHLMRQLDEADATIALTKTSN